LERVFEDRLVKGMRLLKFRVWFLFLLQAPWLLTAFSPVWAARIDPTCKALVSRFHTRFTFDSFSEKFLDLKNPVTPQDVLRSWVSSIVPKSLQDARFVEVLNAEGAWASQGWSLKIRIYEDVFEGKARKLFGIVLEHPDREYLEHRLWAVDAVITEVEGRKTSFNVKLRTKESIDQPMREPNFSIPSFVPQLIEIGDAKTGFLPLRSSYLSVDSKRVDRFLSALTDPHRQLPIIFISKTSENEWLIDPDAVAKRFQGRAVVLVEALHDEDRPFVLTHYLRGRMASELLTYGGAIRVYRPGVRLESSSDRIRHPYLAPSNIHNLSTLAILNHLESQITRVGVLRSALEVETVEDIERIQREVILADFDRRDPQQIDELVKSREALLDENQVLRAEIAGLERKLDGSDAVLDELQQEQTATNATILQLEEALAKARRVIEELTQAKIESSKESSKTENLEKPEEFLEFLNRMAVKFSERLIFSINAQTTGSHRFQDLSDCRDLPVLEKILLALNKHLWPILSRSTEKKFSGVPAQFFRDQSGFDLTFRESQLTRDLSDFESTRGIRHEGKDYLGEAHVKARLASGFIRVHFAYDEKKQKIVITHIVDHLPVYSSSKSGKRR
jgi:hypothetical protein